MKLRSVFALATLLMLTACVGALTPAPAERQTTTAPPPARSAPAIVRAAPTNPTPTPKPRISELIGRHTAQIDAQIGVPDLVRREGEGEVLHVFTYPRGGVRQATLIEARTPEGQIVGTDADDCLARFKKS
jgi:hypothetical protein